MKHLIKTLILILIPFISFSQSLGKSGGKTRIAPTTQIRKGTKPRQVLMTRASDSSLVYADLDTIIPNLTNCIDSSWVLLDTMYHRSVDCGVQKSYRVIIDTINIAIDGQSNSIGQEAGSVYPIKPITNLKVWDGTSWVFPNLGQPPFNVNGADNMALRFAEKLAIENPHSLIRLVQVGNSGQPISHWITSPFTGLYALLNTLNASGIGKLDAFIWDQGESDFNNTNYIADYYTLLTNLYSFPQFEKITKILNVGMYTGVGAMYPQKDVDLRKIGTDNNEYTTYVNTLNLSSYDNTHFTNASMLELGHERIYNTYLNTPYVYRDTVKDITPWRLIASGGNTKTDLWTDFVSHRGNVSINDSYDASADAKLIVNPVNRQWGTLISGDASSDMLEVQQTHITGGGIYSNVFGNGIGIRVRTQLGSALIMEKKLSNSSNWKLNSIGSWSELDPSASNLYGTSYSYSLTGGGVSQYGWYWEDFAAKNANVFIGTAGVGSLQDDHLSIVGNRLYNTFPSKGVEVNKWLKVGNFTTTNGVFDNPKGTLDVRSSQNNSTSIAVHVENQASVTLFRIRDDGVIELNTSLPSLPPAPTTGAGICYFSGTYYKWNGASWVIF